MPAMATAFDSVASSSPLQLLKEVSPTTVIGLLALALATLYYVTKSKLPYPPGPSTLTLLRNRGKPHPARVLHESITRRFGPLASFGLGSRRIVVVGSYKVANDLLEKKSAVTSDRPEVSPEALKFESWVDRGSGSRRGITNLIPSGCYGWRIHVGWDANIVHSIWRQVRTLLQVSFVLQGCF